MNNLEKIIVLLFKHVPVKSVIDGKIKYDSFCKEEFVKLSFAYEKRYSETEISNMWMYYKDIWRAEERNNGRVRSEETGLPVFELLFCYVNGMLIIQNNEILCKYNELLRWREIALEVSEDLLVSAYWAANKKPDEMKELGFSWRIVIGHNNHQLNQIMRRGISENHFHLYGSAPIFHISWLSLMNNVVGSKFASQFKKYDLERRYVNIRYSGTYEEESLLKQYYQGAFIRIFLFSEMTDQRIHIGSYHVKFKDIRSYIHIPDMVTENGNIRMLSVLDLKEVWNDSNTQDDIWELLLDVVQKQEVNGTTAVEENNKFQRRERIREQNTELYCLINALLKKRYYSKDYFDDIHTEYITIIDFVEMLSEEIDLERIEQLFPYEVYEQIWRNITRNNIYSIIQSMYLMEEYLPSLQSIIEALRNRYNLRWSNVKSLEDYALLGVQDDYYGLEEYNDLFSGERWLLYTCMNRIRSEKERLDDANLFYAYVLIKEAIRSELIQSNENVGFLNFHKYQDRKLDLIEDSVFKNEVVRWAVRENLIAPNINSLEIRITPYDTVQKNFETIKKLDSIIGEPHSKYFYTVHFIKSSDEVNYDEGFVQCRNYKTRKKSKKIAKALVKLRELYPQCAGRILGIDAASNEIGCRPEVFGSVFRYLRNHMKTIDDGLMREQVPQLKVTYHVGEDFLDVADGLRAIDEAINFLNMECGDRLGHALALGVNVEEWYKDKNNRILISTQDYLDNLVWIYNRMIQFNIKGMDSLKDYIRKKYSYYFYIVYAKHMDYEVIDHILGQAKEKYKLLGIPQIFSNDRFNFDIFQYYAAWKVRGDEPSLYTHGYFQEEEGKSLMEEFYVNKKFPKELDIRYMPEVFLLNYYYHFSGEVRREGEKRIEVVIKPFYIQGVKAIQQEMQKRIARRGIGIETNPSSNYLISTFRRYECHPIFQFYNKEIAKTSEELIKSPQISVSVNTDDLGVFSTSLENEYALLACALENIIDEEGRPVYNKAEIYDWIDAVRRMGNEQSYADDTDKEKKYHR